MPAKSGDPSRRPRASTRASTSAKQSERDRARADRLDLIVADAEQRVAEQALRYEMAVFDGQDGTEAKKTLRVYEEVLVELLRARAALPARGPAPSPPEP